MLPTPHAAQWCRRRPAAACACRRLPARRPRVPRRGWRSPAGPA
jgi:hypothetical protein